MIDSMRIEPSVEVEQRAAIHAALGEPARLRIVDVLALSDLSPSELGEIVGIESNLLAHHLDVLAAAEVVERTVSHGDRRRRYVRLRRSVLDRLTPSASIEVRDVTFVCTANSARSQLAAALWNASHDVPATSAGTEPAERVHPQAVRAGARRGLDLSKQAPSQLRAGAAGDLVVTVCDRAHEDLQRRSPPAGRLLHWSVEDPAEHGTARAFDRAADDLARRIAELAPCVVARRRRTT